MQLTYGDLPTRDACAKLVMVSFKSPEKNLAVYKFAKELQVYQDALGNEKDKLLDEYGTPDKDRPGVFSLSEQNKSLYYAKYKELLATPIKETLPDLLLAADDFSNANCQYPREKMFWLNAADIGALLEFFDKLKKNREEKEQ